MPYSSASATRQMRPMSRLSAVTTAFAILKSDQSSQLHANVVQDFGGNRGSGVTDRAGQRVDAAHVAGQDFPGNRQPRRQDDAGAEWANARRNRADDREFGHLAELGSGHDQRGAAAALLPTDARIKVSPDQVAGFGRVWHSHSTLSRPLSGPQSNASRIASGVIP